MAGSDEDVDGCDVADVWISASAVMVFATTFEMHQYKKRRENPREKNAMHHRIAVRNHLVELL
jgi:hypothetical protein